MKKNKKLSSFDFTDDLEKKDMLLVKGGAGAEAGEINNCHSGNCMNCVPGCGIPPEQQV